MSDPIYIDSIKVTAGPFTVRTDTKLTPTFERGLVAIERKYPSGVRRWGMSLQDLQHLHRAIGEYLHMRAME